MCNFPLAAYQSAKGVQPVLIRKEQLTFIDWTDKRYIKIPCGQCTACRVRRSKQWAVRCVHEASCWPLNCFLTLTYDPKYVPQVPHPNKLLKNQLTLYRPDFTLFMKRLRKKFGPNIRFFMCGEYGEQGKRPHYHACLFNFDFLDKQLWQVKGGVKLYRSSDLEELWPWGFSTIGDVTMESAAYCARYIVKKMLGKESHRRYGNRVPEFTGCSRRPGIGEPFIKKYLDDVYPKDYTTFNGKKSRPPRYYDEYLKKINPDLLDEIKLERISKIVDDVPVNRGVDRENFLNYQLNRLQRRFENGNASTLFDP